MGDDMPPWIDEQLVARGIDDRRVLDAFRSVPRAAFVPEEVRSRAYEDRPLAIGHGQTISQPYVVALTAAAMQVTATDRVLDVGTGSGYAAAILAHLADEVHTVEVVEELAERAAGVLEGLGLDHVHVHVGDGSLGHPAAAPYDAIGVAAAAPEVPPALVAQLTDDGRLVLPVDRRVGPGQDLVRVRCHGDDVHREDLLGVRYVPLVGEQGHDG